MTIGLGLAIVAAVIVALPLLGLVLLFLCAGAIPPTWKDK